MSSVWSAAGGAARAETDLNMLLVQARKMVSTENDLKSKLAKERDQEFKRGLDNATKIGDIGNDDAKNIIMLTKVGLSFVKLLVGGYNALKAADTASAAAKDGADAAKEAALQAQKATADAVSLGLQVTSQVLTVIQALTDMVKNDKNRKTLAAEAASIDAATKGLDAKGRA